MNIGFACIVHLYISLLIRSHCLSNISRALKGGLISKCYERGVNLTWNLDFQWQSLNTTIHNKLRLYIKENQNMVYVVFGFFFYFSRLFLDASSVASLKMCGSSKCLSFSNVVWGAHLVASVFGIVRLNRSQRWDIQHTDNATCISRNGQCWCIIVIVSHVWCLIFQLWWKKWLVQIILSLLKSKINSKS